MKKDLKTLAIHVISLPYVFLNVNILMLATMVKQLAVDIISVMEKLPDVKEKY